MRIEFRHGPKDGERRFLPVGKISDTIVVTIGVIDSIDYLYRRTNRHTADGYIIFQCLGVLSELTAA